MSAETGGKPIHLKRNTIGGTAPLVCTWMIARTGDVAAPAYYLMATAFVSLIAVVSMRAPQGEALR